MSTPPILSGHDASSITSTCSTHNLTTTQFSSLQRAASAAKATAYARYSNFNVGAALLARDGSLTTGANVENAAYPVGTCAERVAFATAVVAGKRDFVAVAVATDISPPASPCGMCRQFMREFCSIDMPIIMFDKNDDYVVLTLGELLPMSFGPEALPSAGALGTAS